MGKRLFILILLFAIELLFFTKRVKADQKLGGASAAVSGSRTEPEKDTRSIILREYLRLYNSPLAEYSDVFVKKADQYDIDWKLLVAISGVESTFGQQVPYNCNNAWGYGIYGNITTCFASYDEAIDVISKSIRENYLNKWGARNVYEIGRIYAASPTWASRVDRFMEKITAFEFRKPKDTLSLTL